MAETTASETAAATEVIRVSGTYRELRDKIKRILLAREDKEFFTIEVQDGTGKLARYAGPTDIMNFLHKLETVLIPSEDMESVSREYKPVRVFGGCRF